MTLYENEILKCRVNGLPPAHVTWIHNKVIVHNETSVAVLEIPKVDENHERTYNCVASNMLGETFKEVKIQIKRKSRMKLYKILHEKAVEALSCSKCKEGRNNGLQEYISLFVKTRSPFKPSDLI